MISSYVKVLQSGYCNFNASDFEGEDSFSFSVWPNGVNSSNEPDACAMVSIQHDEQDGEQPQEFCVLLNLEACLKLRDMLNSRFPVEG